jgi:hypothetical protein
LVARRLCSECNRLAILPGFLVAQIQQTFHVFPDFGILNFARRRHGNILRRFDLLRNFFCREGLFDFKPGNVFSSAYDEILYLRTSSTYPSAAVRTKRPRNQTSQVSGKVAFGLTKIMGCMQDCRCRTFLLARQNLREAWTISRAEVTPAVVELPTPRRDPSPKCGTSRFAVVPSP